MATPDGDKPISEIEVGDVILAYSEATEEVDIYHVSATHNQRHDTTLDLTIDGETLHTTDEHPFYVVRDDQEQWVQAKHLHIGDAILSGLGETGIVEDIVIVDQPQTMYNLTVALVATYLVGDGQWVVHNVNCPIIQLPQDSVWERNANRIRQRYQLETLIYPGSGGKTLGGKNIAISNHQVQGMYLDEYGEFIANQTGSLHAISGGNRIIDLLIPDYSGLPHLPPENQIFDTLQKGSRGYGRDGSVDTEAKLLEYYAHHLDDLARGAITLYTLNKPCKSCGGPNKIHPQGVIGQFSDMFPNIRLRILYTYD